MAQTYMTRQKKPAAVSAAEKTAAPPAVDTAGAEMVQRSLDAIQNVEPHAGRRLNLDAEMAERMQQQFGIRMDQVELRESSQAADMDARAFAKGNVVQFAPGQFQPDTEQGRHLIEHELSHVAQQARGGIHADVPGLNVNADEGLEHQADMGNLTAGAGAPVSVSGLNAEAAPVQGAFDRIKNWFNKVKRSRKAGKALDARDQAVKEMTAQHNAEQAEITAAMKKQGYSDEEIQAQLMFQRVNQNEGRLERYQDALAAIRDSDVESPEEMDNFHARSARGALRQSSRERRAQREENFRTNVLAGDQEYSQAEQMASRLAAERVAAQEKGYSKEDMETVMAYTAPVVTGAVKDAAPRHAPDDANRYAFVRGNSAEMQPYIKMLKKAGGAVDQGMLNTLAQGVESGPQGSYKNIKTEAANSELDPGKRAQAQAELARFEDRALGDFDIYLEQMGKDEGMIDALRQSADMYSSLGAYKTKEDVAGQVGDGEKAPNQGNKAKENIAGLLGGREEALNRGFNDMLLRSMFPAVGKGANNHANRKQILERANAMMGLQTSALAQSLGGDKEYTQQQRAMRAKLLQFYQNTGLMPAPEAASAPETAPEKLSFQEKRKLFGG